MSFLTIHQVEASSLVPTVSDPSLPVSAGVARVLRFAQRAKFKKTALWLECELRGYRLPGQLLQIHELLGVGISDPRVRRVLSYRIVEGTIPVLFGGLGERDLTIPKLVFHSAPEIEDLLNDPAEEFVARVPLADLPLPDHAFTRQIVDQAQALGEDSVPATIQRDQFQLLLEGLRRELLVTLSMCLAGQALD